MVRKGSSVRVRHWALEESTAKKRLFALRHRHLNYQSGYRDTSRTLGFSVESPPAKRRASGIAKWTATSASTRETPRAALGSLLPSSRSETWRYRRHRLRTWQGWPT